MQLKYLALWLIFFVGTSVQSQEISDTKFGKGLINFTAKDSSFSAKFAPRFQFRSITSWDHDGQKYGDADQNFLIRRARLKFDGWAYSPKLKYTIELGLSNRDVSGANQFNRNTPRIILDAVLKWNFFENFELWAGQTKLPGNVERVVSSANLQLTERSLLNGRFNIDRDIGLQLHHLTQLGKQFFMREKIALTQGEGRNVTEGNLGGLQYTGRLELFPFGMFVKKGEYVQADLVREETPKLMIAATYNFNDDAVRSRSGLGSYLFLDNGTLYSTDITTIFVDAMFKYQGFSFMAEYANRDADDPVARIEGENTPSGDVVLVGNALNFQAGYVFPSNYEIAGRFTTNSYDDITGRLDERQYTLGGSKYIVGHKLKIQTDVSYSTLDGNEDDITWTTGFELHF